MVPANGDDWVDTTRIPTQTGYGEWYAYGAFHDLAIATSNKARRCAADAIAEGTDRVTRRDAAMRARALVSNVLVPPKRW